MILNMTNLLLYGIKFMLFDLILKVVVVNKLVLWLCYVVIIKFFFVIFTLLKENHEYVFGYFFVYIFLCMLSFFYLIDTFFLNPVPHLISSFLWLCLSVWLTVCPNVFLYLFYGQFVLALRVSAGDPLYYTTILGAINQKMIIRIWLLLATTFTDWKQTQLGKRKDWADHGTYIIRW